MKERYSLLKTDPSRSELIMMIISGAKTLAKSENRDVKPQDVLGSVRSLIKTNRKSIRDLSEKIDTTVYQAELDMLLSFLPLQLDVEQTKALLLASISEEERTKKNRKFCEGFMKSYEQVDHDVLGVVLTEVLK